MGNFGPSSQKNHPTMMFGHGVNFNNSNIKFQKDSLVVGSFDPRMSDTPTIQTNIMFGYGV
jgi:hypothetical protein